jgi:nucleotide-binding universal stress UspA family protein
MPNAEMKEVLVHGGMDEGFDRSVIFAKRLAESFGARLHVLYTIEDPLSAGWTAEVGVERLPDVHQAMENEARERLASIIPMEQQADLNVEIVLRIGPAEKEIVAYAREARIDLAVVQIGKGLTTGATHALIDADACAVLALR